MPSPITQATISACVLTAASNIAAQWITAYRNNAPYTIDWLPVLQFVVFTALNSPPNFLWQQFLESSFPSHPSPSRAIRPLRPNPAPANSDALLDSTQAKHTTTEPRASASTAPTLSVRNMLAKFLLDQTLGAALNTVAFSLAMAAFQGLDSARALQKARSEFAPLLRAGWKLWPAVSLVNFALVRSVQGRALVGSVAGLGWGVYLSLVAGGR